MPEQPESHHEAVVNVDAKEDSDLHQVKKRKNCHVAERKHTLGTMKNKAYKGGKDQTPKSLAHQQSKHSSVNDVVITVEGEMSILGFLQRLEMVCEIFTT